MFDGPRREPIRALSGLSVCVEDKECLGIVGPSGSGKTTALRLIAGLETPTAGTISLGGKVINGVPAKQRDLAMVFQTPALYPHMSVYENLGFGLRIRRCSKQELDKRVREVADLLEMTACLAAMPIELSGGQRQRVAIGRALVRQPGVLLLDEPLANVDPTLRLQMRKEISDLRRRLGTTLIYVTHDHLEALTVGDRVAVLRDGLLQQVADPFKLYRRPANVFVASFVGSPPINLFRGLLVRRGSELFLIESHSGAQLTGAEKNWSLRLQGNAFVDLSGYVEREIILGVRPEQITCVDAGTQAPENTSLQARIVSVQTAGPDHYVRARCGNSEFVARLPSCLGIQPDQAREFVLATQEACFFDPVTGKSLF